MDSYPVDRNQEPALSYHLQGQRDVVLQYLETHSSITTAESCDLLQLGTTQARKILREMVKDGILMSLGQNKNRRYVRANNENHE